MNRNLVLLPDIMVRDYAITLSQQIAKQHEVSFVLDGKNFYPHVSLYQAAYPDKNLPRIEKQMAAVAHSSKKFSLRIKGCSTLWGFIFLDAVLNIPLQELHESIVSSLNDLREGMLMDSVKDMLSSSDVSEKMKNSIRAYGSPLAMETYIPHITLCRLKNSAEVEEICASLGNANASFEVDALHVANIGIDGTVNEIFASYPFLQG